jgi:hypothetical protein
MPGGTIPNAQGEWKVSALMYTNMKIIQVTNKMQILCSLTIETPTSGHEST